jgi:hypothetical protein
MKTTVLTLASLFLFGFLAAGCSTVSRLDTEFEEEMTRIEYMSPDEKAALEEEGKVERQIEWKGYED